VKKDFKRGQFVVREGDPLRNIYIVVKGEFVVTKKITVKCKDKKEEAQCNEAVAKGLQSNLEATLKIKQAGLQQLKLFKPRKRIAKVDNQAT
jgi:hypothetical protein